MPLSSPPYVLNAPPISFFWIWSTEKYWLISTDHRLIIKYRLIIFKASNVSDLSQLQQHVLVDIFSHNQAVSTEYVKRNHRIICIIWIQWNFSEDVDGVSSRNVWKPSHPDASVCPRKFHWIFSSRKHQDCIILIAEFFTVTLVSFNRVHPITGHESPEGE